MQYELNDGLAKHMIKPGDPPRNPNCGTGGSNIKRKQTNEIRKALQAAFDEPCDVPGFAHLTKFQYGVRTLMEFYQLGVRWAVHEVHNRVFGRVPLDVTLAPPAVDDVSDLTDDELLARVERLRVELVKAPADRALDTVDGVVIDDEADAGAAPQGGKG